MLLRRFVTTGWHPQRWSFRPGLLPSLLTSLLLPILLALGIWQLDRAAYKQALATQLQQRQQAPPLTRIPPASAADDYRFRRLVLDGRFDEEHSILLDNRIHRGRAGFDLYTPLRTEGGSAILVNRGWTPWIDRSHRPEPPKRAGRISVSGLLDRPTSPGLSLGETFSDATVPPLSQRLDLTRIQAYLGYPIHPLILIEAGSGDPTLVQSKPASALAPARHRAYAFQWFALAASLVVIFIVTNLRRTR